MEKRDPQPERHSDLHDPKLPQIHGTREGLCLQQTHPAPIPQTFSQ